MTFSNTLPGKPQEKSDGTQYAPYTESSVPEKRGDHRVDSIGWPPNNFERLKRRPQMIPVNGFFEYGIMALLGAIGMVGLTIWTLASTRTNQSKEIGVRSQVETSDSETFQYKKAA